MEYFDENLMPYPQGNETNCDENISSHIGCEGNFTFTNGTFNNATSTWSSIAVMSVTSLLLAILILATIVGNVFVIVAVFCEKNLQNVANYLVVSLAVADLMVACLVMPLAAVNEISGKWLLGPIGCDFWLTADVLCCSASILHLLSVAVDRYWAVTDIEYIRTRNKSRIFSMIFMVWLVAGLVSVAPLFGWKDPNFLKRIEEDQTCMISQDVGYQIFATLSTFYVPLFFILLLYWKIWKAARHRIRHRVGKIPKLDNNTSVGAITVGNTSTPKPSTASGNAVSVGPVGSIKSSSTKSMTNARAEPAFPNKLPTSTTFSDELSCHTGTLETSTDSIPSPMRVDDQEMEAIPQKSSVAVIDVEQVPITQYLSPDSEQSKCSLSSLPPPPIAVAPPLPISNSNAPTSSFNENDTELQDSPTSPTPNNDSDEGCGVKTTSVGVCADKPQLLEVPKPQLSMKPLNKSHRRSKEQKKKETLEAKRERKAAITLAIITGAFVVCWLPFFIMALGLALCKTCSVLVPQYLMSAFQWLGYVNSSINPILYTVNPAFRQAFQKILCGNRNRQRRW